jgi:diguanylate cyclase (GGDEF)-like protein
VRLIKRDDTGIAAALIIGAVLVFQHPLGGVLDSIREIELRYHLDLVPALTVLSVALMFHHYRRRQQAKAEARAMAAEAAHARAHNDDLQRIMTFGQELASTLDRTALQQVLWRGLAPFAGGREYWVLVREDGRWEPLVQDVQRARTRSADLLESIGECLQSHELAAAADGVMIAGFHCFGVVNAGELVGVIGYAEAPPFTDAERQAIRTIATLVGIAIGNSRMLAEARDAGVRDKLTGCFRRNHGIDALQLELRRARRSSRPVSVIMFDIDHFKSINDRGGHLRGDSALAAVGSMLKEVLRGTDITCRYGGDEFLVILPDTPIVGAQQVAECLRCEISRLSSSVLQETPLTISLGVAVSQPGEFDATPLVARADAALYRAKAMGRNRFAVATPPNVVALKVASRDGLRALQA